MKRLFLSGMVAISVAAIFYLYKSGEVATPVAPSVTAPHAAPPSSEVSEKKGAAAIAPVASTFSEETRNSIRVLDEVLRSRNDNDPRLDKELRNLSPELKSALQAKYLATAPEDRNARGTIVFLLGRELHSVEDLDFLRAVVSEEPCLSLADCTQETVESRGGDEDGSLGVSTTLAYPQLVAMASLERLVTAAGMNGLQREMRDVAWKIIEASKASPVAAVAKKATDLEKKLRAARP